ncbi:MAG TPA: hypothetical protein VFR37_01055 [Longimicrobium sp.]|nr:hypothetical protein [Longimicrobium sp.]
MNTDVVFLRSLRAWKRWIQTVNGATYRDYGTSEERPPLVITAEPPAEFPCWAYAGPQSYAYEEDRPEYLYRADLVRMLARLDTARGTPAFPVRFFPSRAPGREARTRAELLAQARDAGPGWAEDAAGKCWAVAASYTVEAVVK